MTPTGAPKHFDVSSVPVPPASTGVSLRNDIGAPITLRRASRRHRVARLVPVTGWFALILAAVSLTLAAVDPLHAQQPPAPRPAQPAASEAVAAPQATPAATDDKPAEAQQSPSEARAAAPPAPLPLAPEVSEAVQKLSETVESAEKSLGQMKTLGDEIRRLRNDVEHVITKSTEVADGLRPRLAEVRRQIDKLGPPPGKDQPPEAPAVAAERAKLQNEARALDGAVKTLELTWVRARQTIDKITDLRLAIFTRSLMERTASPLLPPIWSDLSHDWPQFVRLANYVVSDWWRSLTRNPLRLMVLVSFALAGYVILRWLSARLMRIRSADDAESWDFFARAAAAAWIAPVRALPAVLTSAFVYLALDSWGLLYYPSDTIARSILFSLIIFSGVSALVVAVLSPTEPRRRMVSLSDRSARSLSVSLQAIAAVYSADLAMSGVGRILYVPLSMSVVQSLIASIAFSALLARVLLTRFAPYGDLSSPLVPRLRPRWLKIPLWLAVIAILAASALGFVALARFAAQQLVMTGVVGAVATLLFLAIRAFTQPGQANHAIGEILEKRFGFDEPRRRLIAQLTEFLLSALLVMLALPVLLLQWGFSTPDIIDWAKAALFGFEIGQFRISLARVLLGLLLFTALLFLTRLVQRWLRDSVLSPARMDVGLANSIDTGVGYAGTALGALLAVSYAGFDVSNIAIVAGALSVGIGFGLQSIVNNFVSGLILLVERPVKVGDWIVVKEQEGYVRRISVRATEIETFDKASVIVPNSELITGVVKNWTHRDAQGRIVIKLRAPYGADPEQVLAILRAVSAANNDVLKVPAPLISLDAFGEQACEYAVRAIVADVNRSLSVGTALRVEILKAFRLAGIGIPHVSVSGEDAPSIPNGRIEIRARVSSLVDPEIAAHALATAASRSGVLAEQPQPVVLVEAIAANDVEFSVAGDLAPGMDASSASALLRQAAAKALHEAGLARTHSQHDIHLRDLDGLKGLVARALEEREKARAAAAVNPNPSA